MEFRIADSFTGSLSRLTGDEQKAVKTTAFDLQLNQAGAGMSFHKLDKAKDKNFWSVRVNGDIRLIVHKTASSMLLCYVDHHDKAYNWAQCRKLETHPKTGAAQLVVIRETVREIKLPKFVEATKPLPKAKAQKPLLYANFSDDELLSYGVPVEWLADVRAANEDTILTLAVHLPAEAAEALLELATGGKPRIAKPSKTNPFDHPDAQRRFRVMSDVEELQRALDYPWEKWTVFLHPEQREIVERNYAGPARVCGSAGTGKTIVALHRAVHLARTHADSRVLLATFTDALANALRTKLKRLLGSEPRLGERVDVHSLDALGVRLHDGLVRKTTLASRELIISLLQEATRAVPNHKFSPQFLLTEWEQIVDAWQLADWPAYRDVARLGRRTRLSEPQRQTLWSIFQKMREALAARGMLTTAGIFTALAETIARSGKKPFDFAVVDESQDITIAQLRFFASINKPSENTLFFAGDLGQRIFQQPFSWKSLGVDIRGRSLNLRVNYRTSHQIRMQADRLLGPEASDVDGNTEKRNDTISVFNGPAPIIKKCPSAKNEMETVSAWLSEQARSGVLPHECGLFVRSLEQLDRAKAVAVAAKMPFKILDEHVETISGHLSISTMHIAKGLEFRAVAVMACDDEILPLQSRIESVADESDLKEIYDTERQLLYVACTRARDALHVSGVQPASEFLDDMA